MHFDAGHIPMLLCPEYCEIMEHIGQASLGASDAEVWQLTKVRPQCVRAHLITAAADSVAYHPLILLV